MVHPEKCSSKRASYEFMDSIANSLLENNWQDYHQTEVPGETDDVLRLLTGRKRNQSDSGGDSNDSGEVADPDQGCRCTPMAVQQLMSGKRSKKKEFVC